jgi:hypothetical protein
LCKYFDGFSSLQNDRLGGGFVSSIGLFAVAVLVSILFQHRQRVLEASAQATGSQVRSDEPAAVAVEAWTRAVGAVSVISGYSTSSRSEGVTTGLPVSTPFLRSENTHSSKKENLDCDQPAWADEELEIWAASTRT